MSTYERFNNRTETGTLDSLLVYLFPKLLVQSSPWADIWTEKDKKEYFLVLQFFFPAVAVLYAAHYFFYDNVLKLQPPELWFRFRWSMFGISILCFLLYSSPLRNMRYYKIPAIAACWIFSFYQAKVSVWYPEAPWLYAFAFTLIATILLRSSILNSVIYAGVIMSSQWIPLLESGLPKVTILSASFVTIVFLILLRSNYLSDIRYFLLSQSNLDNQRRNIELNIEFTNRIKAFIPSEIAQRLEWHMNQGQMTVLQAIDEVLRPRVKEIACIFSDIRGYTQSSRDLDGFVNQGVIPDVKKCTDSIEAIGGIPRKVGDLLFAYFDDDIVQRNLVRAIAAGISIAKLNEDLNSSLKEYKVKRYILIATGKATVGNIGGVDSSIEITALGSPVNFLSRVDELTKTPQLQLLLDPSDLLLSAEAITMVKEMNIPLEVTPISLRNLGLSIRDFPSVEFLYTMKASENNYQSIMGPYRYIERNKKIYVPNTNQYAI